MHEDFETCAGEARSAEDGADGVAREAVGGDVEERAQELVRVFLPTRLKARRDGAQLGDQRARREAARRRSRLSLSLSERFEQPSPSSARVARGLRDSPPSAPASASRNAYDRLTVFFFSFLTDAKTSQAQP